VVLACFRTDPMLLVPHLPAGTELDTPDDHPDLHLVSVVALRFEQMHVHGMPVPTARSFAEVNVRFHARHGETRGVVFLREFVSNPLVILGARLLYQEPYRRADVEHSVRQGDGILRTTTTFRRGSWVDTMAVTARDQPIVPHPSTVEHFIKEKYGGFGRNRSGRTRRYRVTHPVWETHPILQASIGLDPGGLLGGRWRAVDWAPRLHTVVLAAGSPATIHEGEPL
jgi:uncharacterized protein